MSRIATKPVHQTPWQRVIAKFGISPAEMARRLGRHRSKLSRALSDEKGLINGKDQELILDLAKQQNIHITASDLVPEPSERK